MINRMVRKFSFQSCTLSPSEVGFTHQPLYLSSQSSVSLISSISESGKQSQKVLNSSMSSHPETSKGNDKHQLQRVKGKESRANPESSP